MDFVMRVRVGRGIGLNFVVWAGADCAITDWAIRTGDASQNPKNSVLHVRGITKLPRFLKRLAEPIANFTTPYRTPDGLILASAQLI